VGGTNHFLECKIIPEFIRFIRTIAFSRVAYFKRLMLLVLFFYYKPGVLNHV